MASGMSRFAGSSAASRSPSASFWLRCGNPGERRLAVSGDGRRLVLSADELLGRLNSEAVVQVGEVEALLELVDPLAGLQLAGAEPTRGSRRRTACVVASQRTGSGPQSYSAQRGSPSSG